LSIAITVTVSNISLEQNLEDVDSHRISIISGIYHSVGNNNTYIEFIFLKTSLY